MYNRARVRPSRGNSVIGMIGGVVFVFIGIFVMIPKMAETNGPVWFGVLWTLLALCGVFFHGCNAFSERGIATEEIQFEHSPEAQKPALQRMKELEALREQGVISDQEYQLKRREIIAKL